jgi:hypothetical protein
MQPTIPSPEMIGLWINLLMTGKATAKEQELQVGDHSALSSSTSSVSQGTRSLLSLLHSHHNCCATYAHDDDKWRIMQGASGGHGAIAFTSAVMSRRAGAVDAAGADET